MKIISFTPGNAEAWNDIASHSPDAWMFHEASWLAMTEQVWDLVPYHFLLETDGRLVGIFPLQRRRGSSILRSSFFGTGGPALVPELKPGERRKALEVMFAHAARVGRSQGAGVLEIHCPPLSVTTLNDRWQVNPLAVYGYEDTSTHTWVADLSPPWEEIESRFSHAVGARLRKARAVGYRIEQVQDKSLMKTYYQVHRETCAANGIKPHPEAYFDGVFQAMVLRGKAVIWFAGLPSQQPVAFAMTARYGAGALYWASCCRRSFLNTGVNYLLQIQAMRWAREQGCLWYENGEAFPGIQSGKHSGLTVFKGQFGGELHRFHKGILRLGVAGPRRQALRAWKRATEDLFRVLLGGNK